MRLFTGLDLPGHVATELDSLIAQFRPLAPLMRWSTAANLHVTTKFIGEWPAERLDELTAALAAVPAPSPFVVKLSGLGWFPNPHQPRIFWANVKAPPELSSLAAATETRVEALGIAREDRPYTAHLTLAKIGVAAKPDLAALRRAIALLPSAEFGEFQATAFHLYLSESGRYSKLASFPLRPLKSLEGRP